MKTLAIKIVVFSLFLKSCNIYQDDFIKINIIGFENVNNKEKVVVDVEIYQNGETSSIMAKTKFKVGSFIGYAKKNFALDLNDEFKFNELKKDDDRVLGASVIDKTFLRKGL